MKPIRVGIDIGGVIISRKTSDGKPTKLGSWHRTATPIEESFEGLATLIREIGRENVYLISITPHRSEGKTLEWLARQSIYEETGLLENNVFFTDKVSGKRSICSRLKITHFIDDRLQVLGTLDEVPHRYLFQPNVHEVEKHVRSLPSIRLQTDCWEEIIEDII